MRCACVSNFTTTTSGAEKNGQAWIVLFVLLSFRMAGACCKCPVTLSVFKRSLSVAPRGSGSAAPRFLLSGWRLGERGLQEAARPSCALRPTIQYRHTAFFCLSCQESMSESLRTCYLYLNQTSRSFAAVIQALDGELRWVKLLCSQQSWLQVRGVSEHVISFSMLYILLRDIYFALSLSVHSQLEIVD